MQWQVILTVFPQTSMTHSTLFLIGVKAKKSTRIKREIKVAGRKRDDRRECSITKYSRIHRFISVNSLRELASTGIYDASPGRRNGIGKEHLGHWTLMPERESVFCDGTANEMECRPRTRIFMAKRLFQISLQLSTRNLVLFQENLAQAAG